jgi:hemophore-related protein
MLFSNCAARRAVAYGIAAGVTVGTGLIGAAPAASGDPPAPTPAPLPPGCTAADLAQATAGVAAATSTYLFTHPDINAYFSSLERSRPREDVSRDIRDYLDANPQVKPTCMAFANP